MIWKLIIIITINWKWLALELLCVVGFVMCRIHFGNVFSYSHFVHLRFRCFIFVHSSFICSRKAAVFSSSKLKICFNTNVWTATTSCRDPAEKYWNQIASDISHSFVLSHVFNTGVNEMAGAMHREVVRIAANNRYLTTFTCCCFFCLIFFFFRFFNVSRFVLLSNRIEPYLWLDNDRRVCRVRRRMKRR